MIFGQTADFFWARGTFKAGPGDTTLQPAQRLAYFDET